MCHRSVACWCLGPRAGEGALCLQWGYSVDVQAEVKRATGVLGWMHTRVRVDAEVAGSWVGVDAAPAEVSAGG